MKKLFKYAFLMVLSVFFFATTACKKDEKEPSDFEVTITDEVSYPCTIKDQANREVTIEKEPTKIISGYYISSSILLALGEKDNLVGVENMQKGMTERPIYTKSNIDFNQIGGFGTKKAFNTDKAATVNPDLVVIPYSLKDQADTISTTLDCPVLVVNPESEELMNEALKILGLATNSLKATKEIKEFSDNVIKQYGIKEIKSNAYFVSAAGDKLSTVTDNYYQSLMLKNAGFSNVAGSLDGSSITVSAEQIIAWNPKYVVIASESSVSIDDIKNDTEINMIDAVKNNNVYKIPSNIEAWDSPVPSVFLGSLYLICQTTDLGMETFNEVANEFYQTFYGFSL